MNSIIRRIDLTCKLFAPVVSGFIISFISLTASAVFLAVWNILSVCFQYWLLMSVYNGIPSLREANGRRISRSSIREVDDSSSTHHEQEILILSDTNNNPELLESCSKGTTNVIQKFLDLPYITAWKVYIKQDVVLPGLALALLFFTVLR